MLNPSENALTVQWDIIWQKAAAEKWQRKIPAEAFHARSKRKGESPCGNGGGTKNMTAFLDTCVSYSPQPLLERSQAPLMAQISSNSGVFSAVFIAGEACFRGSYEMVPGGPFPLNL